MIAKFTPSAMTDRQENNAGYEGVFKNIFFVEKKTVHGRKVMKLSFGPLQYNENSL